MFRLLIAFIPNRLEQGCECCLRMRVANRIGEQFSLVGEGYGSIGFGRKCQGANRLLVSLKLQQSLRGSGVVDKKIALRIAGDESFVAKRGRNHGDGRRMRVELMNQAKASRRTFLSLTHRHPD